jgi:hypothetical protein
MQPLRSGDQAILYDREATIRGYASIKVGDCAICGCDLCRNFATLRNAIYPVEFRRLLDQLGIDFEKEAEVVAAGPVERIVHYEGWFYLAGELVEAGEKLTAINSSFQYFFRDAVLPSSEPRNFGDRVLAIEFSTQAPWVIERPLPTQTRNPPSKTIG